MSENIDSKQILYNFLIAKGYQEEELKKKFKITIAEISDGKEDIFHSERIDLTNFQNPEKPLPEAKPMKKAIKRLSPSPPRNVFIPSYHKRMDESPELHENVFSYQLNPKPLVATEKTKLEIFTEQLGEGKVAFDNMRENSKPIVIDFCVALFNELVFGKQKKGETQFINSGFDMLFEPDELKRLQGLKKRIKGMTVKQEIVNMKISCQKIPITFFKNHFERKFFNGKFSLIIDRIPKIDNFTVATELSKAYFVFFSYLKTRAEDFQIPHDCAFENFIECAYEKSKTCYYHYKNRNIANLNKKIKGDSPVEKEKEKTTITPDFFDSEEFSDLFDIQYQILES